LRGAPSDVCWLPDVFGYSTALPQILKRGDALLHDQDLRSSITLLYQLCRRGHDGSDGAFCPTPQR
jgi:hypothetical protein